MKKIFSFLAVLTMLVSVLSGLSYAESRIEIKVNDQLVQTDAEAFIENNRTLVPIRFVAEKLGAKVDWNGDLRPKQG